MDNLLTKLQARRLPWQKPLSGFVLATSRRFRDIYKVNILSIVWYYKVLMFHYRLSPDGAVSRTSTAIP
jgi:hypothetical protein